MIGWHHRLKEFESEQTPEDSEGQETWCSAVHTVAKSWTRLNNNEKYTVDDHHKSIRYPSPYMVTKFIFLVITLRLISQ